MRKTGLLLFAISIIFTFNVQKTYALSNVKDTITTSRPSAASPLSANAASGVSQLSIYANNSRYLASDSATIIRNTGTVIQSGINVASQSSAFTTVYLGQTTGSAAQNGTDTLIVPITATHTVSFISTAVPASGHIKISFPAGSANSASPSATTFNWNNLQNTNVSVSGTTCSSLSVATPGTVDCTVTGAVSVNTGITIVIGSSNPTLINPTKNSICSGSPLQCISDQWTVTITTTDASSNVLDTAVTKINTIESVQVLGTVEPFLTFTITGVTNGTNINTISASCGSIQTNSGIDSTATAINLGVLSSGYVSSAAQQLQVSTNASSGYVLTATSSGRFINPSSGQWILDANGGNGLTANDTPAPATMPAGTPSFGIHPCGGRTSGINTDQWVNAGSISTAKFSNPWNTGTNAFYNTLASYTGGPVSLDNTAVLYGSTISGTTPAGLYSTSLTYVATATF